MNVGGNKQNCRDHMNLIRGNVTLIIAQIRILMLDLRLLKKFGYVFK